MDNTKSILSTSLTMAGLLVCKWLFLMPNFMVNTVGNCAYIDMIAKSAIVTVLLYLFAKWFSDSEYMNMFEAMRDVYGRYISKIIYILLSVYFIVINAASLRICIESMQMVMGSKIPKRYFAIVLLAGTVLACLSNIESLGRLISLLYPLIVFVIIIGLISLATRFDINNIFPVFGIDKKTLTGNILLKNYGVYEIIILFFILNKYRKTHLKKIALLTCALFFIPAFVIVTSYCFLVPYPASKSFFLPLYQIARMIKAGNFMERLEPVIIFVWCGLTLATVCYIFRFTNTLIEKVTAKKNGRYIWISIITAFILAMIEKNENKILPLYEILSNSSILIFPGLMFITLIFSKINIWHKEIGTED